MSKENWLDHNSFDMQPDDLSLFYLADTTSISKTNGEYAGISDP